MALYQWVEICVPLGLRLALWVLHQQCRPDLTLGVSDRIFLFLRLTVIFKTVEVLRKKPELSFPFLLLPPLLSSQRSRDGGIGWEELRRMLRSFWLVQKCNAFLALKNEWNAKLFYFLIHPLPVSRQPYISSSLSFILLMRLSLLCFYVFVYPIDCFCQSYWSFWIGVITKFFLREYLPKQLSNYSIYWFMLDFPPYAY